MLGIIKKVQTFKQVFFICLSPEFLPVSRPTERWHASRLGAALLCSSWAGSVPVMCPDEFKGFIITCWSRQYGSNLETQFSRDLETARFEPGAAGSQPAALPQSYRASGIQTSCKIGKSAKNPAGNFRFSCVTAFLSVFDKHTLIVTYFSERGSQYLLS